MFLSTDFISFREKFRLDELGIAELGGWRLSVRASQLRLGAMVLSSSSGAMSMGELTPAERQGMGDAFALTERLVSHAFRADRVNYLCLMMQDPIVHFHVLPRYSRSLTRYGRVWNDPDWPGPPVVVPVTSNDDLLAMVKEELKRVL